MFAVITYNATGMHFDTTVLLVLLMLE